MAIATKVTIEEDPPIHAIFPSVSTLHRTVPITPSGWIEVILKKTLGAINAAYRISATARFIRR